MSCEPRFAISMAAWNAVVWPLSGAYTSLGGSPLRKLNERAWVPLNSSKSFCSFWPEKEHAVRRRTNTTNSRHFLIVIHLISPQLLRFLLSAHINNLLRP